MHASELRRVEFDPELKQGAANAVQVCLNLQPDERITLITDDDAVEIAAALLEQIDQIGATCHAFILEKFAPRPLQHMPPAVLQDLAQSPVSIFAASARPGELAIRQQMTTVVEDHKIRHAHMVNITPEIMVQGMRADYAKVDDISSRLIAKARQARTIRVTSPAGTEMEAEFSPKLKWLKTSGLISTDKWGNLPGGEIFTSPANVNGVFVVDGVVGDYLCAKYGDIKATPLTIEIENSRIKHLACENKTLLNEFRDYTRTDENSDRVGEFAIGTNIAVKDVIGNILQDEKIPGIHIAFGHPYTRHTGADWVSTTHIDCVGRDFNIWLEDEQIMKDGAFLID